MVLSEAAPFVTGDVPKTEFASAKVTVPVGFPEPEEGITEALKTIGTPCVALVGVTVKVVTVDTGPDPPQPITRIVTPKNCIERRAKKGQ